MYISAPFGHCDPASLHCFGRLPQHLIEDQSELLAVDSACNIYRYCRLYTRGLWFKHILFVYFVHRTTYKDIQ